MSTDALTLGFRVVGGVHERRAVVDAHAAFVAHCDADPKAEPHRECYLSAFRFGPDFREHMTRTGSPKRFAGPCGSPWLWFDIDRTDDLPAARADARRLTGYLLDRYPTLDEDHLLTFFSGAKGFHLGLPLGHGPPPSPAFPRACKRLAEGIAVAAGVTIDRGVYDAVRLFRAPNSRHPGTGRYKRPLTHDELMTLSLDRIRELAKEPRPTAVPEGVVADDRLAADWAEAAAAVATPARPRSLPAGQPHLNRATLDFIREGAREGERAKRLFAAAANLAEFPDLPSLVHAVLTEAATDSGLPPGEVRATIDNAIRFITTNRGDAP